jgi:nitroreductase
MNLKELVLKSRSYRRFKESHHVDTSVLESLIELARLSPTGANRQPLKFMIFNTPAYCDKIFPLLSWAGYLEDWAGPVKGEWPSSYIFILGDKTISESFAIDHGIAAQSIMLGATEAGLGGCIIASINRESLRNEIEIPEKFEILLVLAIGKPVEKVVIEEINNNDVKYWRDKQKTHHVPKRSLKELIIKT